MRQLKNSPKNKTGAAPQKSVQKLLEKNRTKNQALKKLLKFIEEEADANVVTKKAKNNPDRNLN